MMRNSPRFWPLLAAAILLPLHLKLDKSDPRANSSLESSPSAVRLWFSQSVELPATKITLADALKKEIATKALTKGDDGSVVASLEAPLASGKYNVSWRTMAKDGHVIKGEFSFSVK